MKAKNIKRYQFKVLVKLQNNESQNYINSGWEREISKATHLLCNIHIMIKDIQ